MFNRLDFLITKDDRKTIESNEILLRDLTTQQAQESDRTR